MDGRKIDQRQRTNSVQGKRHIVLPTGGSVVVVLFLMGFWLATKAATIERELNSAAMLVPQLQTQVYERDGEATRTVDRLASHTAEAQRAATDPIWLVAASLPWIGPTFGATTEIAVAADDMTRLGATPLVHTAMSFQISDIAPRDGSMKLDSLVGAEPALSSASHAVAQSTERINRINSGTLLPQVAESLETVRVKLNTLRDKLGSIADAAAIAPAMLGTNENRTYLLMIQNNSESRASGGIPGALALLRAEGGRLTLADQMTASELGAFSPSLTVDTEQQQIYSTRLGKFMQDVNLTPDFPTAGKTAKAMWEKKTGKSVDGVISIDPIALSYLLGATGPVPIETPAAMRQTGRALPAQLSRENAVQTLLSDVYAQVASPRLQDAYFASVAERVFTAISNGQADPQLLFEALGRAVEERRILIWADAGNEQSVIAKYGVSGSISGSSISPAQFGVYFNDGTGAKMDYYVKRTVQLVKECPKAGYEETTVRITSTNTAPADAATSLPAYVTGQGIFGVPAGSVQTNVVAYGPVQAHVETAKLDGQKANFAPYLHSNRPVGVIAIVIAPGESKTVDFKFAKIVQHAEPNVVVTPTVQSVNDVTLPTKTSPCR